MGLLNLTKFDAINHDPINRDPINCLTGNAVRRQDLLKVPRRPTSGLEGHVGRRDVTHCLRQRPERSGSRDDPASRTGYGCDSGLLPENGSDSELFFGTKSVEMDCHR